MGSECALPQRHIKSKAEKMVCEFSTASEYLEKENAKLSLKNKKDI